MTSPRFPPLGRLFRHPYALILLGPVVLMSPILFAGKAMFWGTPALQFVPWWDFAWASIKSGQLPLWNPLVGMGAPLLANYQTAMLYPPTWIYFFLAALGGTPALAWGQALLVCAHLIWAGTGMALLAHRLGLRPVAQVVAGLAFGLSNYLVARSGFLSINATAAWLPWILLACLGVALGDRPRRRFLLLALTVGLQLLAGHAQISAYTLALALAWTMFWAWHYPRQEFGRRDGRKIAWALMLTILAVGLGFVLAAGQLLPTAEYLAQSQRAGAVDFDFAMTYSFWPWRFLTLLAPDLFGSPVRGDYWGYGAYWEDAIYLGLLPLLLAWIALSRRGGPPEVAPPEYSPLQQVVHGRAFKVFLLGVMALSFLLALGRNTIIFPWLYRSLPGFDMFQAPTRFTLWAIFCLALLAGIGADRWTRPQERALYWTRLGTAGALAVTIGAGLAWGWMGDIRPTFLRATALAGMFGLGAGLLALIAPEKGRRPSRRWAWAVGALVVVDLLVAGWGLNPGVDLDFYRTPAPSAEILRNDLDGGRLYLPASQEYDLKFARFLSFKTFDPGESWQNLRAVQLPNLHMLDGLPHVNNFDPLLPARYDRWLEVLNGAEPDVQNLLLNLSGVSMVEVLDPTAPSGVRWVPRGGSDRWRWIPCALLAADGQQAWDFLAGPSFNPQTQVVIEGLPAGGKTACDPQASANIQILEDQAQRTTILVQSSQPGWLVQADVWYPGWKAKVDGQASPLLRADYLFRAVPLEAGEHRVELAYLPASIVLGLSVSMLAWLGWGVAFVRQRPWRNRHG